MAFKSKTTKKKEAPVAPKPETNPAEVPKPLSEVELLLKQADELQPQNPRAANALRDKAHRMEG